MSVAERAEDERRLRHVDESLDLKHGGHEIDRITEPGDRLDERPQTERANFINERAISQEEDGRGEFLFVEQPKDVVEE
jgi:hypothetical protein